MRLNADLESGRSLVSHPRRKAGKGAVKLVHNEKRGAASLKPPPNAYRLAEARMKSVSDACFSLLFAGSMSCVRGGVALREVACLAINLGGLRTPHGVRAIRGRL
jgi:hypothetical protein